MKITVKGNSGCAIEIVQDENGLVLQKMSSEKAYASRLSKQFEKQASFEPPPNSHIKVPRIYEIVKTANSTTGKMEYVYSKNFINYFETAGFEQILFFADTIINFLDYEISKSPPKRISSKIFVDKIKAISKNISSTDIASLDLLNRVIKECLAFKSLNIPIGTCHGDLTLSNILFNGSDCFLIDFLDSFIESPLMDVVKIRQDTYFGWSQLMSELSFDKIRLNLIMKKLDEYIDVHFHQFDWYVKYYRFFQIINLCRILPYAQNKRIRTFLHNKINQLLGGV